MSQRCEAKVSGGKRRCKNKTKRGTLCTSHQVREKGIKVTKSTIPNAGLGVFTTVPRKKGNDLADYGGIVSTENPPGNGLYVLQLAKNKFIDAEDPLKSGYGRFVNACRKGNPCKGNNSQLVYNRRAGTASVRATKNIAKGEEVFVPYSRGYWKNRS